MLGPQRFRVWRMPPGGQPTVIQEGQDLQLMQDGCVLGPRSDGTWEARRPGLAAPIPVPKAAGSLLAARVWGPAGEFYYSEDNLVHRVKGDENVIVAGLVKQTTGGNANELPLEGPLAVATMPAGEMLVLDQKRILRVKADGTFTDYATIVGSDAPAVTVGQEIAKVGLPSLRTVVADAQGRVTLLTENVTFLDEASGAVSSLDAYAIRVDAAGKVTGIVKPPAGQRFWSIAVTPDGTLYVAHATAPPSGTAITYPPPVIPGAESALSEVAAAGSLTRVISGPSTAADWLATAAGADGAAYLTGDGQLRRYKDGVVETLATDPRLGRSKAFSTAIPTFVAVGPDNRLYFSSLLSNQLLRFDPVTKVLSEFAGAGGTLRTGATVDDGFSRPGGAAFDAQGNLVVPLRDFKQVIRIPREQL
jgi:streptogramin lyase